VALRRLADPPIRGVRALLLDALGTLIALEPPAPRLRELLVARFGVRVDEGDAQWAIAAEISHYRAHMLEGRDAASVRTLQSDCAEVLRAALPQSPALAAIDSLAMTALLLDALRFRAFADARELLIAARAAGVRAVAVSNWDASLPQVLARVGLLELLDGVITSAASGAPKPASAVFAAALALAGAAPHQALHVGDSPREDVAGATAAGIIPVLLARDRADGPDGVLTVSSLRELVPALSW
jgi:putative hydrolase of the HAD superfamily